MVHLMEVAVRGISERRFLLCSCFISVSLFFFHFRNMIALTPLFQFPVVFPRTQANDPQAGNRNGLTRGGHSVIFFMPLRHFVT